jgi:hypothetical protein
MPTKNSNDIIGHRTRDLPACSEVPQPTAPPRGPLNDMNRTVFTMHGDTYQFTARYDVTFNITDTNFMVLKVKAFDSYFVSGKA